MGLFKVDKLQFVEVNDKLKLVGHKQAGPNCTRPCPTAR